jgi:prepilin-type N-terminal cleavage/methylation domain-containing protein
MLSANSRQPKTEQAFTLIELLVVIAIVGILAGLAVVSMSGATEAARIAKLKVYSNSIRNSLMGNRVSEWKFDEGAGTTTADTVGNNSGILTGGPSWEPGVNCVSGRCLSFDGLDDYVSCGNDASLNPANALTIELWFKMTERRSLWQTVVGKYPYSQDYLIFMETGGLYLRYLANVGSVEYRVQSLFQPELNTWYFVVFTVDPENLIEKSYINGIFDKSTAIPNSLITHTANPLYFARGGSNYFKGSIDETRIYSAALTVSDIREDYLAGLDKLLANGQITKQDYQQRLAKLNSTYVANK